MSRHGRWEYLHAIYPRYQLAPRLEKRQILDEFCRVTGYHRKSALRLLNGPVPARRPPAPRRRPPTYGLRVIQVLAAIWRAAAARYCRDSATMAIPLPAWNLAEANRSGRACRSIVARVSSVKSSVVYDAK